MNGEEKVLPPLDCVYLRVETQGLATKRKVILRFGYKIIHEETREFKNKQREEFLIVERKYATVGNSKRCSRMYHY